MIPHKTLLAQLISTAVAAIGMTVVWLTVTGWGADLAKNLFDSTERVYENLVVTPAGVPLIFTQIGNLSHRTYRKLDGTVTDYKDDDSLNSCNLGNRPGIPGLLEYPIPWRSRLGNTSDVANPAVFWHFVRDGQAHGKAYFVGYDSISKRTIGFIGRQGFRVSVPSRREWFDVGRHLLNGNPPIYASRLWMDSVGSYNQWRHRIARDRTSPPEWIGILIDGDRLLKIDFRQRTVGSFDGSVGATAVAFGFEPRIPRLNAKATDDTISSPVEGIARDAEDLPSKRVSRLLVRYPDCIVVWDLKKQTNQTFTLPQSLHSVGFYGYTLGNGQLIIVYGEGLWERGPQHRMVWLDTEGNQLRTELVKLVGWVPPSEFNLAYKEAWAVPLPAYWIYRMLARRPFELMQDHGVPTYPAALQQTWQAGWGIFVILIVLAAIATVIVQQWHHNYLRPQAVWWGLFALLFSVPGLIAYRLFHNNPAMETCQECGNSVPSDRDACANCEQIFPKPSLLGTEVFA